MKSIPFILLLIGWMAIAEEPKVKELAVTKTAIAQKVLTQATKSPEEVGLSSSLKKAHYKSTGAGSIAEGHSNTGFFSLSVSLDAFPLHYFKYHGTSFGLRYGSHFSAQSSFEAGIQGGAGNILLMFKYNYDFIRGTKWVPGLDISLLVGNYSGFSLNADRTLWLDAGLEIGPYIRTFISRSHALLFRTGVACDTHRLQDSINLADDLSLYLSLSIQWHF